MVGRLCMTLLKSHPTSALRPLLSFRARGFNPGHSHTCQTPWSVFQDGLIRGILSKSLYRSTVEPTPNRFGTSPKQQRKPDLHERTSPIMPTLPPIGSISAISGTLSLSFQSSLHLSLTVLVRYRSPTNIQLQMEFTTHLELQSQTTRLVEIRSYTRKLRHKRGCHPSQHSIPEDFAQVFVLTMIRQTTIPKIFSLSFSRFTRRYWGNPCQFLFLRLVICLNSAGNLVCWRSDRIFNRNFLITVTQFKN